MSSEAASVLNGTQPATPKRRLLVVAFHYPPDNSSTAVLRTHRFTLYLERHGWASDIVSVDEKMYGSVNTTPPPPPAHARIHRTWAADTKRLFGIAGRYPAIVGVPDRYWPWIIPGYRRARKVIETTPVEAIYTTYPPVSALMIGLLLKRATGLPWVADLRDPWVEDSMTPLRRRFETVLERRVLREADAVICNTPALKRWFLQRYSDVDERKLRVITNGYDESDFLTLEPQAIPKFEILYPGNINAGDRNPEPLLAGVARAVERGWLPRDEVQLTFLGTGPYGNTAAFKEQLDRYRISDMVRVQADRIPYEDALRQTAGADVLVSLSEPLGDSEEVEAVRDWAHLQVPAKVYEYLRLGRPLLALVSGGAVAELLEKVGGGAPIHPGETNRIAEFLYDTFTAVREGRSIAQAADPQAIKEYSRERLTVDLADLLAEVSSPPPHAATSA